MKYYVVGQDLHREMWKVCLVHSKIESLIEIGIMWWKSWKFMCVGKFWCDEKIKSLKKNFETKHGQSCTKLIVLVK
jgi:hypothetical protein